jgi:hypothetical protein
MRHIAYRSIDLLVSVSLLVGFVILPEPEPLWFLILLLLRGVLSVFSLALSIWLPPMFRMTILTCLLAPLSGLWETCGKVMTLDPHDPELVKAALREQGLWKD